MKKGNRPVEKQEDIQLRDRVASMTQEQALAELEAMGIEFDPENFAQLVRNRIAQIDLDNARREREAFFKGRGNSGGMRAGSSAGAVPSLAFYHKKVEDEDALDDAGKEEDAEVLAALSEISQSLKKIREDSNTDDEC